jgi:hypothetical protein
MVLVSFVRKSNILRATGTDYVLVAICLDGHRAFLHYEVLIYDLTFSPHSGAHQLQVNASRAEDKGRKLRISREILLFTASVDI